MNIAQVDLLVNFYKYSYVNKFQFASGAVVCACVINRLLGDEITSDKSLLQQWESFPQKIVSELVKRSMEK